MKSLQRLLIAASVSCLLITCGPLLGQFGEPDVNDDGSGGSSGGSWKVTCTYDGNNVLLSKTCESGGTKSCNCP